MSVIETGLIVASPLAVLALFVWLDISTVRLARQESKQVKLDKSFGVRKYVARPIVVEAVMLRHGNLEEVLDWVGGDSYGGQDSSGVYIHINTLEGYMAANQDDYVVKGTHGEFYPVKNDIFNHKYEEYEE